MGQLKLDRQIKNPCYNAKTKTDCPRRAIGCREKCNLYKIYKTLKRVEEKQKTKEMCASILYFEITESKRKMRILGKEYSGKRGWNK